MIGDDKNPNKQINKTKDSIAEKQQPKPRNGVEIVNNFCQCQQFNWTKDKEKKEN